MHTGLFIACDFGFIGQECMHIKRMCQACPGCALANPTLSKSSELVYNFPIEAPFLVMHFDAYAAGKHAGFEGSECYLLGSCGMTGLLVWNLSPMHLLVCLPLSS